MTPDPLTQLITDLCGLVATLPPAIDLTYQLAGVAPDGTQPRLQLFCNEDGHAGTEDLDVPDQGAAPASYMKVARREPGQVVNAAHQG